MKHYKMRPTYISQGINNRHHETMVEDYEQICKGCKKPFKPFRPWHSYCMACNTVDTNFAPVRWERAA